ncbi:MAG TPA: hypothetical protein VGM30_24795 [Puia sp.]|jgi:hypothetical protein
MIVLKYKNGDHFIAREDKSFFIDNKTGERLRNDHLVTKVMDLASDHGKYGELYYASLQVNGEKLVEQGPFLFNKPVFPIEEAKEIIDYSMQLKDLKKITKGFRFTQRIKWNSDGVFVTSIGKVA